MDMMLNCMKVILNYTKLMLNLSWVCLEMWIGSEEWRASSSLVETNGGGLRRWSWREGGRGGGPLTPPTFGLGGRGGGDRGSAVRGILGGTGALSRGMGGGGEKSGVSTCKDVEEVSGMGTLHMESSPLSVSSKSRSKSGAIRVALAECWPDGEEGIPPHTSGWAMLKYSSACWCVGMTAPSEKEHSRWASSWSAKCACWFSLSCGSTTPKF